MIGINIFINTDHRHLNTFLYKYRNNSKIGYYFSSKQYIFLTWSENGKECAFKIFKLINDMLKLVWKSHCNWDRFAFYFLIECIIRFIGKPVRCTPLHALIASTYTSMFVVTHGIRKKRLRISMSKLFLEPNLKNTWIVSTCN